MVAEAEAKVVARAVAEYIQDYMVSLLPLTKSHMVVNIAHNTKASSP